MFVIQNTYLMEDKYESLRVKLEQSTEWPSVYMFKFIIKSDKKNLFVIEDLFNNLGAVINTKESKNGKYTSISINVQMSNPEAVKQLKKIPEVLECHYTTGNWSILVKILCKDNEHLMYVLNKEIQTIPGVSRTETFISLDQQIDRQIKI